MYLRLRTYFDGYTQLCPRYKNKQPYNYKTELCINIHNSANYGVENSVESVEKHTV